MEANSERNRLALPRGVRRQIIPKGPERRGAAGDKLCFLARKCLRPAKGAPDREHPLHRPPPTCLGYLEEGQVSRAGLPQEAHERSPETWELVTSSGE